MIRLPFLLRRIPRPALENALVLLSAGLITHATLPPESPVSPLALTLISACLFSYVRALPALLRNPNMRALSNRAVYLTTLMPLLLCTAYLLADGTPWLQRIFAAHLVLAGLPALRTLLTGPAPDMPSDVPPSWARHIAQLQILLLTALIVSNELLITEADSLIWLAFRALASIGYEVALFGLASQTMPRGDD